MQMPITVTVPLLAFADPEQSALLRSLLGMAATAPTAAPKVAEVPGTQPPIGTYWAGQGGIYVGTAPAFLGMPQRHLIASQAEKRLTFGPYDHDAAATSHVDGPANTRALLAEGAKHPAAQWAAAHTADGHNDFHLPSRMDLLFAYLQAPKVFDQESWYWSSTQVSRNGAFAQHFANGSSGWYGKDGELRVRAFRWIPLTA
ncbi:MAG: hypothetical protein QG643_2432 [Pseudomonadota bacterium]|nr:hypothetical protein [Pseudomonadota bacterium]